MISWVSESQVVGLGHGLDRLKEWIFILNVFSAIEEKNLDLVNCFTLVSPKKSCWGCSSVCIELVSLVRIKP